MLYHLLAWFPMILIAIANGAFREVTFKKWLPELAAHQVSTLTAAILLGAYIWAVSHLWPLPTTGQATVVGILWVAATVAFEVLFGRYVAKHTWRRLLQDYNILKGRVWPLLLVWIGTAPYLFHRLYRS